MTKDEAIKMKLSAWHKHNIAKEVTIETTKGAIPVQRSGRRVTGVKVSTGMENGGDGGI